MVKIIFVITYLLILSIVFIRDNFGQEESEVPKETFTSTSIIGSWTDDAGKMTIEVDGNLYCNQYVITDTYQEKINSGYMISSDGNSEYSFNNISLSLETPNKLVYRTNKKIVHLHKK